MEDPDQIDMFISEETEAAVNECCNVTSKHFERELQGQGHFLLFSFFLIMTVIHLLHTVSSFIMWLLL